MADGYQAVGAMVAPIKAPDTLGQLNSILGIQQQRQQLQAQAMQLQQTQAYQGFQKNFDPTQFIGADGTVDDNAVRMSQNYKASGPAKQQVDDYIMKLKTGQMANKTSLQGLQNDSLEHLNRGLGALQGDPDVMEDNEAGRKKTNDFYNNFRSLSPVNDQIGSKFGRVVIDAQPGHLGAALRSQQLMGMSTSEQRSQLNPTDVTSASGAHFNRQPMTGDWKAAGGEGAAGASTTSPQVAGAQKRNIDTAVMDTTRASDISDRVATAPNMIEISKQVDDLANQINSGKFSKFIMDKMAAAGDKSPEVTARQVLAKDLGQIKTGAGAGATSDQRLQTILSGFPDETSAPGTIHTAMDVARGKFRQDLARGQNLQDYEKAHPDLAGFRHSDDAKTSTVSPLMHEFKSLNNKADQVQFYRRHFQSKAEAQDFTDQLNGRSHATDQ